MPNEEQREKLLKLMRAALQHDNELRDKYQVGEKFRFIRDRLQALQARVEESLIALQKQAEQAPEQMAEDEILVYVHLFNAQGLALQSWQKMLNPSVFYEYSVNRPIYAGQVAVEAFIRLKPNKFQHGYLIFAVKKVDILPAGDDQLKDNLGNLIIKVREGSLRVNRLISFMHNDNEYTLSANGELTKKDS